MMRRELRSRETRVGLRCFQESQGHNYCGLYWRQRRRKASWTGTHQRLASGNQTGEHMPSDKKQKVKILNTANRHFPVFAITQDLDFCLLPEGVC